MNAWTHMPTNARPNPRCGIVRDPCHTAALALSTLGDWRLVVHIAKGVKRPPSEQPAASLELQGQGRPEQMILRGHTRRQRSQQRAR